MRTQRPNEMQRVESFCENLVEGLEAERIIARKKMLDERKTVLIIQHIEITDDVGIFHVRSAERHCLVKYRERVPHRPVCLVCNDVQ